MPAYVTHLAGNLPSFPIPQQSLRDLSELPLADTKFFESAQIDILVGANVLWLLPPRSRNHFRVDPNRTRACSKAKSDFRFFRANFQHV